MKVTLLIPLAVGLSASVGYALLLVLGMPPHVKEMVAALIPTTVAALAAVTPALVQRSHGQAAVVQGAFQGMIIHIGMTLLLGVLVFLVAGLRGPGTQPFALWTSWFFMVTLAAVSASLIHLIRSTPFVRPLQKAGDEPNLQNP